MNKPKFSEMFSFSNEEIKKEITNTELKIFKLKLKKATQQIFKPHELKFQKKKLAHLKTYCNINK